MTPRYRALFSAVLGLIFLAIPALAQERHPILRVVGDENYPPYLFLNAQGEEDGYLVDVWRLWEKQTGIRVELIATQWDRAQQMLLDGEADVIENIFATPERAPLYDFSAPYASLPVAIYRDTSIGGLTRVDSLHGFQVGVMQGDACVEWLQTRGIDTLVLYADYKSVIEAAKAEEIKVFCMDEYPANFYLYQLNAHRDLVKAFDLYQGEFHRAVRKGDRATLSVVERGMAAIPEAEMEALSRKWLKSPVVYLDFGPYLLQAAAVLSLVAVLIGLWIVSLRRAVARRTAEQRAAQHSLRERETQLRSLGDNLPNGFIYQYEVADGQPQFHYISAGAEEILGFSVEQLRADASLVFAQLSTHAREQYAEQEARSAHLMSDFSGLLPYTHPDGKQRWLMIQSRPRQNDDSTIVWDGIALDVTEKQKADVELERYRQELEILVAERTTELQKANDELSYTQFAMDRAGIGSAWNNAETGQFLYANDEACRQLGYTREELMQLNVGAINPMLSSEEFQKIAADLRKTRTSLRLETQHRRKDGSTYPAAVTVYLHRVGVQEWFITFFEDISERKAAEAELLIARDAAEEATRAKSDFLANMSHEIRTPMNAIMGMSHLALQTELTDRQRNYIEKVHRSAEALLGIINDILDFSKIEAGKLDMETADFQLEDVLDNLANLVGLKAEEKGLELMFELPSDLPTALVGDALRLGQVLINLGNNAVKFTEPGGEILVRVGVIEDRADRVGLQFSVRDSGIGLTSEQQRRLFQSFSQADSSTTRKYGGSGLGLAICKRLTTLMGGDIWVESVLGVGSTFHFTAYFGQQSGQRSPHRRRAADLQALRVLVVDDNRTARDVLHSMLTAFGFEVTAVASGAEAISQLEQAESTAPFDLVLLDWKMPGMDGLDTVRAIDRNRLLAQSPTVIMVTAYGRDEAQRAADGLDLAGFLTKPVTPSHLLNAILIAMGREAVSNGRGVDREEAAAEALVHLRGAHILLVEDNPINQELALELLTTNGMTVAVANNGQEALDVLGEQRFDGVLMDCQMPVMDGYQATRAIRANPQWLALPVLAMTANVMSGDREKALAAGMNDHIGKPVKVREMLATMARWIHVQDSVGMSKAIGRGKEEGGHRHKPLDNRHKHKGEVVSLFTSLPGIDTQTGLHIAQGNQALYHRLLRRFRDTQSHFAGDFATALAAQEHDPDAATRCAHTLKSVAANIGAEAVRSTAAALEAACDDGQSPERIATHLQATLDALQPVLAGLAQLDPSAPAVGATVTEPAFDLAALTPELHRLRVLLEEDNTEATEVIAALSKKLGRHPLAEALRPVAKAVNVYDFEAALYALERLESDSRAESLMEHQQSLY